ncbi:MAG: alpha/beta hydrolase fold domain-containing protein [Planctomycetaceae bacterium]|nr:alpha/beta hydrolase fold domain-containing protein [Planctomycetales bacterium]MCB9875824.1 alpha/beta hydrolase fold domain-containing protein [Planctomycetaceae bacterium]
MKHITAIMIVLLVALGSSAFAQDTDRQNERRLGIARFQQFFSLPGVEFSNEQQSTVEELRKEFIPRFIENQKQWDGVYSDEQQQARRKAFQEARDAGKGIQGLRGAVETTITLTAEQKEQRATIRRERDTIQSELRTQLIALLTDEQRERLRQPRRVQQQIPPTHADVKYGAHERNVMDVWLAASDEPTPVLVSIHGGGFLGGNKSVSDSLLQQCLDSGISVAAITYRFSSQAIAPASFLDSARAVQYIRHHAKEWNIDPNRFAATGGSAGAGISLWLGFHDDLADPDNEDPILRQSTRLTCMLVSAGQSSYDPRFIRKLFPEFATYKHGALASLFDVDLNKLDDLPDEKYRLFEEVSPLHHLTKDDVPAMLSYGGSLDQEVTNVNIGIHHARFGKVLKEKMDELGIRCIVNAGGQVLGGGGSVSPIDFMKQEFGMTE